MAAPSQTQTEWWVSPAGKITSAPSSEQISFETNGFQGPFSSRAQAVAAQAGAGQPGTGSWFVITARPNPKAPFTVQVSQKPFPAGALEDSGPYPTKAAAQAAAAKLRGAPIPGLIDSNPLTGIAAVGGFFSQLSDPHTWLRVGEVAVGVILLAVALNALLKQATGTSPVQVIGKVAGKIPKVVPV